MAKKMNAYQKIRKAMRDNERSILAIVRKYTAKGEGWDSFLCSHATFGAIQRLKDKKLIRYSRTKHGYIAIKHKKKVVG